MRLGRESRVVFFILTTAALNSSFQIPEAQDHLKCLTGNVTAILIRNDVYEKEILLNVTDDSPAARETSSAILTRAGPAYVSTVDSLRLKDTAHREGNSDCPVASAIFVYVYTGEGCPTRRQIAAISKDFEVLFRRRLRAQFMLLISSRSPCDDVAPIFAALERLGLFPLVVVASNAREGCRVVLHAHDHATNTYAKTENPGEPHANIYLPHNTSVRLFRGRTLRVGAVHNPPYIVLRRNKVTGVPTRIGGTDFRVLKLVSHVLDMPLTIVPRFDEVLAGHAKNGTTLGLAGDLIRESLDIIGNGMYIYVYDEKFKCQSQMTTHYVGTKLCAVVPKTERIAVMGNYNGFLDIVTFSSIFLGIAWLGFLVFRVEHTAANLLQLYATFLGSGHVRYPSRWSARCFLVAWTFGAMMVSTELHSRLTKSVFHEVRTGDITTLKQLDLSGRRPVMPPGYYDMIFDAQGTMSAHMTRLRDRTQVLKDYPGCVKRLMGNESRGIACIMQLSAAKMYVARSLKNGKETLRIVDECFFNHWKAFVLRRNAYYFYDIDTAIMRINDAGLTGMVHATNRSDRRETKPTFVAVQMSLKEFETVFIVVVAMSYAASILIFLGEVLIGRVKEKSARGATVPTMRENGLFVLNKRIPA